MKEDQFSTHFNNLKQKKFLDNNVEIKNDITTCLKFEIKQLMYMKL